MAPNASFPSFQVCLKTVIFLLLNISNHSFINLRPRHTHTTTTTTSAAYLSINVVNFFFFWNAKSMRSFTLLLADHIENTHILIQFSNGMYPVSVFVCLIRTQISHVLRETHPENVLNEKNKNKWLKSAAHL